MIKLLSSMSESVNHLLEVRKPMNVLHSVYFGAYFGLYCHTFMSNKADITKITRHVKGVYSAWG